MKKHKDSYIRNVPHLQPQNGVFAITICLSGTLPKSKIEILKDERTLKIAHIKQSSLSPKEEKIALIKVHQLYFNKFDDLLDNETSGPTWLKRNEIAKIIAESLHFRDGKDFKLVCYCVMSNHIHLVIYQCKQQLFEILRNFKSYTSLMSNNLIYGKFKKGDGRPNFWLHESYDHLIRNRKDFYHQVQYTVNNPVKANLVKSWQEWNFTYLRDEYKYILE